MHAAAPSRTGHQVIVRISADAIIRATVLLMALVAAAYFSTEIHEHTHKTDQQALAGVR